MMARTSLGGTGLAVSRLGFGVSGPHGLALVAPAHTRALIRAAYASGVRLFDTAPFYGDAQRRLGQALLDLGAKDAVLISKVGTERDGLRLRKNFAADAVRTSVLRSIETLGVPRLDVLLLHGPPPNPLEEGLRHALDGLRKEGLILHVGVCGRGEEIAILALDPLVEIVQAPVWSGWPAWCAQERLGFLGIEALAPLQARRPWLPRSAADVWHLARRVRHWRAQHAPSAQSPASLLSAALDQRGVNAVLMTTTRLAHLRANIACANPA